MTIRINRSMSQLLEGAPKVYETVAGPVPASLAAGLTDGFKEIDSCVVPSSYQEQYIWSDKRQKLDNIDDETGFECALSMVHIDAFCAEALSLSELARIGCSYALHLRSTLLASPVSGAFRIIVDAQLPDPELEVGNVCTVRFHKVRPGQVWLHEELESYKMNAVWVVDFETTPANQLQS